jgi:hypothetical protein
MIEARFCRPIKCLTGHSAAVRAVDGVVEIIARRKQFNKVPKSRLWMIAGCKTG